MADDLVASFERSHPEHPEVMRRRVERLSLGVAAGNAAALRLYRATGFVIYGTEPAAIRAGGADHDEHLMTLDLRG